MDKKIQDSEGSIRPAALKLPEKDPALPLLKFWWRRVNAVYKFFETQISPQKQGQCFVFGPKVTIQSCFLG